MSIQRSLLKPPDIIEIIRSAQKVNWHYTKCCIELGFERRVPMLRSIIENEGYSWGILAHLDDPISVVEQSKRNSLAQQNPVTPDQLAALAEHFDWNQSAVCRHLGLKSVKAGFSYRKLKRWGYENWTDFCLQNGKTRPPLSIDLLVKTGNENEWDLSQMVEALQYKANGAVVSWIQRNGYSSWVEFRLKHSDDPDLSKPIQLTFALLSRAAQANDWKVLDVEESLGYARGGGGIRKWLQRRGYTWGEYIAEQQNQTEQLELLVETPATDKNDIALIAAESGWHIDVTAWAMDTDRQSLLEEIATQGFKNWNSFYEAKK